MVRCQYIAAIPIALLHADLVPKPLNQLIQRRRWQRAKLQRGTIGQHNGASPSTEFIWRLRCAFFRGCRDVSDREVQLDIAQQIGIPATLIEREINGGVAFSGLAADYQDRDRLRIEGSPTFVLNQGRQKLYGNLGYRVIEANIRELLREPRAGEMSWC